MIEFILMKKHELEIGEVTDVGEGFEIVFGEIEFDEVGTAPEGGNFEGEGGVKNEKFEGAGVLD